MKKVGKSKEKSTKSANTFCRNKPNSPNVQMNLNNLTAMNYAILASLTKVKNKPNSNPIKANSNPIIERLKMNANAFSQKNYENISRWRDRKTKPIQSQNKPNLLSFGLESAVCSLKFDILLEIILINRYNIFT